MSGRRIQAAVLAMSFALASAGCGPEDGCDDPNGCEDAGAVDAGADDGMTPVDDAQSEPDARPERDAESAPEDAGPEDDATVAEDASPDPSDAGPNGESPDASDGAVDAADDAAVEDGGHLDAATDGSGPDAETGPACLPCAGCLSRGVCVAEGDFDPNDPCRQCRDGRLWTVDDGTSCDDGLYCNGDDTCRAGICEHAGDPCPEAGDGDGDCSEACDEQSDRCSAPDDDGTACDDGVFCNGLDYCQAGSCESVNVDPCPGPDGDADCQEACDESSASCSADEGAACGSDTRPCGASDCIGAGCAGHPGCPVYVDVAASGKADGRGWRDAFPSIQQGIDAAVARGNPRVFVAAGTYLKPDDATPIAMMADGVSLYGGLRPYQHQLEERTAEPLPPRDSSLDGEHGSVPLVIGASDATLEGFVLHSCRAEASAVGCGMEVAGVTGLVLRNLSFESDRFAPGEEIPRRVYPAFGLVGYDSELLVEETRFEGHRGDRLSPSGSAGAYFEGSTAQLEHVAFVDNVGSGQGAAITMIDSSLHISKASFEDNGRPLTASSYGTYTGGALYAEASTLTLTDSTFRGNTVAGYDARGGAIAASDSSVTLTSVRFLDNGALGYSGSASGISFLGAARGSHVSIEAGSDLRADDVLFAGAATLSYGVQSYSSIYVTGSSAELRQTTFSDGAGVVQATNATSLAVENSVFQTGAFPPASALVTSLGNCSTLDRADATFIDASDVRSDASGEIVLLEATSACVDTGDDAVADAVYGAGAWSGLRGDWGAVEGTSTVNPGVHVPRGAPSIARFQVDLDGASFVLRNMDAWSCQIDVLNSSSSVAESFPLTPADRQAGVFALPIFRSQNYRLVCERPDGLRSLRAYAEVPVTDPVRFDLESDQMSWSVDPRYASSGCVIRDLQSGMDLCFIAPTNLESGTVSHEAEAGTRIQLTCYDADTGGSFVHADAVPQPVCECDPADDCCRDDCSLEAAGVRCGGTWVQFDYCYRQDTLYSWCGDYAQGTCDGVSAACGNITSTHRCGDADDGAPCGDDVVWRP